MNPFYIPLPFPSLAPQRIAELEAALASLKARHRALEYRRALDLQGYTADVGLLRQKARRAGGVESGVPSSSLSRSPAGAIPLPSELLLISLFSFSVLCSLLLLPPQGGRGGPPPHPLPAL